MPDLAGALRDSDDGGLPCRDDIGLGDGCHERCDVHEWEVRTDEARVFDADVVEHGHGLWADSRVAGGWTRRAGLGAGPHPLSSPEIFV